MLKIKSFNGNIMAQYSMANEYMARAKEKSYDKFVDIGVNFESWMNAVQNAREDLNCFIIWHPEKDKDGNYKMKTVGNMVDQYLTPEGLMDIILYSASGKAANGNMEYGFVTNNDNVYPARSPIGMFDNL
ncbi:MAG: hypothetical protein KC414_02200, partial [Romboutsia sp.]|nr:hypothetical protein [Romboutsia sp.]